jgi:hypothetical protein
LYFVWQFVWQFFGQAGGEHRRGVRAGGGVSAGEGGGRGYAGGGAGGAGGLEALELAAGADEVAGDVCFVADYEVRGLGLWHEARGYGFGGWGRE